MNVFDKLFGAGPAVTVIMKLGFMPKDSDYFELTSEQYESYYKTEGYTDALLLSTLMRLNCGSLTLHDRLRA